MDNFFKLLREKISRIVSARDMHDVNDTRIDTVLDEMHPDVHVFHASMGMRIMSTSDSTLIVAVKDGGRVLWKAELRK